MMLYATRAYKPCVQISTPPSQPIMLKKKCANTQMRIYYKHKSHFPGTKKMKFGCFTIFVGGRGIHQNTDSAYLLEVRAAVFYLKLLQIMLLRSKCAFECSRTFFFILCLQDHKTLVDYFR